MFSILQRFEIRLPFVVGFPCRLTWFWSTCPYIRNWEKSLRWKIHNVRLYIDVFYTSKMYLPQKQHSELWLGTEIMRIKSRSRISPSHIQQNWPISLCTAFQSVQPSADWITNKSIKNNFFLFLPSNDFWFDMIFIANTNQIKNL